MPELSRRIRNAILLLGLVQGLLLLVLHLLVRRDVLVPATDMAWLWPGYAIAIGVPAALQLLLTDTSGRRLGWFALGLLVVLALTGAYAGYTVGSNGIYDPFDPLQPYMLTTFIGWYVLLPFVQAWLQTGRLRPDYPMLFEFAWNNGIVLLIAALFTGIFWALLGLWSGLFEILGVHLFRRLFFNVYFGHVATATVFAGALYIGRSHVAAVVTVRRVILAVFKSLLPLLAVIAVLFLAALPYMGLEALWATGQAAALMLMLQLLMLFFLNAVFQNGQGAAPYAPWLRTFMRAAIVLLPVYTVLCLYALYLRVDQYGWTTERFWAALLMVVVGLHVFGYAGAALRRRGPWMAAMAPVNVTVAAIIVVLSVAVSSPLLNALRTSADSQVARLLEGEVGAQAFDYGYLRFDLGRPGIAALERLKDVADHPEADAIRTAAAEALERTQRYGFNPLAQTTAQAATHFSVYPEGATLSDSFLTHVVEHGDWHLKQCIQAKQRCAVLAADMNGDRRMDYVVFRISSRYDRFGGVYGDTAEGWQLVGEYNVARDAQPRSLAELQALLADADYGFEVNPWRDLKLGGRLRRLEPR